MYLSFILAINYRGAARLITVRTPNTCQKKAPDGVKPPASRCHVITDAFHNGIHTNMTPENKESQKSELKTNNILIIIRPTCNFTPISPPILIENRAVACFKRHTRFTVRINDDEVNKHERVSDELVGLIAEKRAIRHLWAKIKYRRAKSLMKIAWYIASLGYRRICDMY